MNTDPIFLITDTPASDGTISYTVTIISGALPHHFGPWNWGARPREQVFDLN